MKTRSILGLGLVTSLVCGTASIADMSGLDYRIAETNALEGDFNWTVEIYAVMNEDDRLDAVAGDSVNQKLLTTSTTFFQSPYGGPTSMDINPIFFDMFPTLRFDSWVTIGAMDNTGDPYAENVLQNIGIDWSDFEDNGGDISTNNGVWFILPIDLQGESEVFTNQNCEDKFGVLIARVTTYGQDASVFMGALFQGRDGAGTPWSNIVELEVFYPTITDCNNNSVDDACDIINGTSNDDNGNGIPDECEYPDCNNNGIDDNIDIADGTSEDCNVNGVPDECEMADGDCNDNGILDECEVFDDCNSNGIPDECETFSDCNDNGIPDECEDLQDWDGNGVPDACEGLVAYNTTSGSGYDSFDAAISGASDNDVIWVDGAYADTLADMDFHGAAVDVQILGGGSPTAAVQMAAGASLHVGSMSELAGINSDTSGTASVASDMHLHATTINVFRDSSLNLDAGHMILGSINQRIGSELSLDSPTTNVDGLWTCAPGSTVYASSGVSLNGSMVGTFDLFGSMSNAGTLNATDDVLISNDLNNDGLVAIHRGVLYVLGNLTNNGTILGEVDGGPGVRGGGTPPAPGDGLRVIGHYAAGSGASLFMQHENWRLAVGGNFDVAIDDNLRFDMSQATLDLNSHSGQDPQLVEVMSMDLGGIEEALDPTLTGAFPFGLLRINNGATVDLVDNYLNNPDDGIAEVIYTELLVVEAGATLRTNGYIIYTSNFENSGLVDNLDDIIIIDPPTPGDINGDGLVNIADLLILIGDWGACPNGCGGDIDGDGFANIADLLIVIANWT